MIEAEICRWKRDYLFVLQSVITVPTGDVMDGMEVNLYGASSVSVLLVSSFVQLLVVIVLSSDEIDDMACYSIF